MIKLGTIEPKYTDLHPIVGCIQDDTLAFIYGAIAKYGISDAVVKDADSRKELKEYLQKRIEEF